MGLSVHPSIVAREQLCKHVPLVNDELLEASFSMISA
jgi:hypothetical protein